jgi:hypothetical protein
MDGPGEIGDSHPASDAGDAPDLRELASRFADFSRHTESSSPLYSRLAAAIAADPDLCALLGGAPPGQRQPVLLFACVHRLLLDEPDAPLARHYPSLGGTPTADVVSEWRRFCADRRDDLVDMLGRRSTQTNEVGRSALFLPIFARLADEVGPLAHVDVGASAGLNLLVDHYDYHYEPGGSVTGGSTVTLTCGVRGSLPVPAAHPAVAMAVGLDRCPVDVNDPDDVRWLEACVWPDQVERFARLEVALALAAEVGVDVRPGDAVTGVGPLTEDAAAHGHPVVTTSWVLNYLSGAERTAFVSAVDQVGRAHDITWIYAENPALCPELPGAPPEPGGPSQPTSLVVVRWRRGERLATHVGDAHPHGRWLHWLN